MNGHPKEISAPCTSYPQKTDFTSNSIGARIRTRNPNAALPEDFSHPFFGQMSALHFVSVKYFETQTQIHTYLQKAVPFIDIRELFPFIAYGNVRLNACPEIPKDILPAPRILQHVFMVIDPKCASEATALADRLYTHRVEGKTLDVCNPIDKVYKRTRVHDNHPLQDVFANVGGFRCLLPFLSDLSQTEPELSGLR